MAHPNGARGGSFRLAVTVAAQALPTAVTAGMGKALLPVGPQRAEESPRSIVGLGFPRFRPAPIAQGL